MIIHLKFKYPQVNLPHLQSIILGDSSVGMLAILEQKIKKANVNNMMPLKVNLMFDQEPGFQTDLIYSLMTMHHIVNIDLVIETFYQMLNPNGYLCIADLDEEDCSFHGPDFIGHNGFNQAQLANKLARYKFRDIHSKICYEVIRKSDHQERKYPLFIMIAQK